MEDVVAQLRVGDKQLEYAWFGPGPAEAPTLVFLHEGLGCVAMWRDFPKRVVDATGCGALVYSRAGYGNSDAADLPRPVRFMHDEGMITLPQVLNTMNIREAILVGHSDGGSIAIIHAGGASTQKECNYGDTENTERMKGTKDAESSMKEQGSVSSRALIRGLILLAPHVFVEELGTSSIAAIADEYRGGQLKRRLERYHGSNVDRAFWGWNRVWLDPAFRSWNIEEYLAEIRVPVLVIQGEDDRYGTLRQVQTVKNTCAGPVRTLMLEDCGHSPHLDQPERTLEATMKFLLDHVHP